MKQVVKIIIFILLLCISPIRLMGINIIKQFGNDNNRFDEYLKLKKEESFWRKKAEELQNLLWIKNKPLVHYYRIQRIKY